MNSDIQIVGIKHVQNLLYDAIIDQMLSNKGLHTLR